MFDTIDLSVLDTFTDSSAEEILIFSSVLLCLYGGRVNSSSVKKRLIASEKYLRYFETKGILITSNEFSIWSNKLGALKLCYLRLCHDLLGAPRNCCHSCNVRKYVEDQPRG